MITAGKPRRRIDEQSARRLVHRHILIAAAIEGSAIRD
jgi:hypothetical protein